MIIRYYRRYCMLWGRMSGVSRLLLFVWTHGCTFRRSWGLSILPFCILERTNDVKLERSSYVLVCVIYSTTHKIILLIGRSLFVVWGFNDNVVLCLICQWTRCLYWCCCCCFWFAVVVESVCVSYCRCFFTSVFLSQSGEPSCSCKRRGRKRFYQDMAERTRAWVIEWYNVFVMLSYLYQI